MHPPFFFVLPKKNAPCTVEEKGAWCPNPAFGGFGQVRGSQQEAAIQNLSRSVGRGFGLAETCRHAARDQELQGKGAEPIWSASLSAVAPPTARVARSEAERAGPEVCQIRQPPQKDVGSFRLRGCSARVSSMSGALGRRLASHGSSDSPDSRSGPNLTPKRVKFAALNAFFFHPARRRR